MSPSRSWADARRPWQADVRGEANLSPCRFHPGHSGRGAQNLTPTAQSTPDSLPPLSFTRRASQPESRVRLDWFGEEKLVNDCGDGVPCPETKHQLNRRSELVLEAFTDRNREYEFPKELLGKDVCDESDLFEALQREFNSVPTVYFDFDKSIIRSVHQKELERVGIMLSKMKNLQLYLAGHTDQRGNEDYNMKLAERRAKAVMDYLVKRGVDAARMQYEWFGKSQPVNDCGSVPCTEAMHQQNRRTELHLKGGK